MKQKFTTQRCANRHPKKVNFNEIERMPVEARRKEDIFGYDSASYEERQAEKAKKAEYRSNPNYIK